MAVALGVKSQTYPQIRNYRLYGVAVVTQYHDNGIYTSGA
jgi:hypothetical protein